MVCIEFYDDFIFLYQSINAKMVLVNNREFKVYALDTIESFIGRIASLMETLPQYIYFVDGLPSMETITREGTNVIVENILKTIQNDTGFRFSLFYKKNREKLEGLDILEDVLKPYLVFNTELRGLGKDYIDVVLFDFSEDIKSIGIFDEVPKVEEIWKGKREAINSLMEKIDENRRESEEKLREFARFDEVKKGDVLHSEFSVEKIAFSFNLTGFDNINALEIFNEIVLNKNIPFASCGEFFKILREKVPLKEWADVKENVIMLRLCQNKTSDFSPTDYTIVIIDAKNDTVNVRLQLDINKNNLDEEDAMDEIVRVFTPTIVAVEKRQNFINGVFYIANQRMNNYVFSDLVMNDTLFSNILAINENMKTSKKKTGLYVHFDLLAVGRVFANLTEKVITRSDYHSNINREMFPIGSHYIRVKITRTDSLETALKFVEMICKLFHIYNTEYNSVVKIYREYIPSFAKEELKSTRPIVKERELNLRDIAPEIFHPNYSRKCIYKPTIISEDDVPKYGDNRVVKFPKDDKYTRPRYYVCNHDKHKFVGLRDNPFDNKDKFPFIPCCYIKNQELIKGSEFRQYYHDDNPPMREIKQQHLFVTDKFVSGGLYGRLPRDVDALFNASSSDAKYIYIRKGVDRSQSSFLQCVMEALNLTERKNLRIVLGEREKLANENFAASCRQEMYDRTVDEIMDEIVNKNVYMSPRKYIHGVETYFDCDIFLFTRDSVNGELIVPDHLQAYYKNKSDRDCIFILEHMGSESDNAKYPQCEMICRWNSDNETDVKYVFNRSDVAVECIEKTFNEMSAYYLLNEPLGDRIMHINGEIMSQTIDSYGKTRILYVNHGENVITVMTSPIPPLSVREVDENRPTLIKMSDAIKFVDDIRVELIGRNFQNDIDSLVCMSGNVKIAIPVEYDKGLEKLKIVNSDLICVNFNDSLLRHHTAAKKYARYFTEYLFWFFSQHMVKNFVVGRDDAKDSIEKFVEENIVIDPVFEFGEVAKFFSLDSGILRDGKIVVTSKEILLRLVFVLRLKIQRNFSELINYHKRKMIESYYMSSSDFTRHWQQIVLEGFGSVLGWIDSKGSEYVIHDEVAVNENQPYFFMNKLVSKRVFLAKNTDTIDEALNVVLSWTNDGHMPLENISDTKDLEFLLFFYRNHTNIDSFLISGRKNTYGIKILGYRNNDAIKFVALVVV